MANELTEIIAMAASPFIFAFCPVRKRSIAAIIVIGRTRSMLFVRFNTEAMAIAPKATWESPSPINENLFKTKVTPRREEQREINMPTINAYLTKG